MDLEKLFKITTKERLETCFIYDYERLTRVRFPACSKKAGRNIETSFSILDLKDCSVMQAYKIKDILQLIISIGQNYYPETMGMMVIVNAPWIFGPIWSFIKIWMDEVTVKKIAIVSNAKDAAKEIFQHCAMEDIPEFLGGTCKCEGGCFSADSGPWEKLK